MSVVSQIAEARQRLEPLLKLASFNTVVNVMSNHERNQWARTGYPGLREKDPTGPAEFVMAPKLLYRLEKPSP